MAAKKIMQRAGFKTNEFVVYPAHGVGQITSIEEQEIADLLMELFVIKALACANWPATIMLLAL